ncbi:MAG: cold shock domain-containing protein [Fluviicola sp.]|nr:cold shock domain-containing protein [Fluviicola sp.]
MARSQETFSKKEKEKKRLKKRKDKALKREERKASSEGGGLDNMMAYVDEFGVISDTPPDENVKKKEIKAENIEIGIPKRTDLPPSAAREGRVVFFNDSKGYGFIKETDTEEKYFVHVNGLLEEIKENDLVNFELERGMKGMNAVQVKIVNLEEKKAREEAEKAAREAEEKEDEEENKEEIEEKNEESDS